MTQTSPELSLMSPKTSSAILRPQCQESLALPPSILEMWESLSLTLPIVLLILPPEYPLNSISINFDTTGGQSHHHLLSGP